MKSILSIFAKAARQALMIGVVVTMAFLFAGFADETNAQGALRSSHGDWQIRCDTPPGAPDEQCALLQSVSAEDRQNVALTVIVLKTADQQNRIMRVLAPLGVLIPSGLGLRVDEADVGRTSFVRCLPNGCVAEIILQDDLIRQLQQGTQATFIIFQTPEQGIGIPVSLAGFSDGYTALP